LRILLSHGLNRIGGVNPHLTTIQSWMCESTAKCKEELLLVLWHGNLLWLSHLYFISLISLVNVKAGRGCIFIFESLNQHNLFFVVALDPWFGSPRLLRIRSRHTPVLYRQRFADISHILFCYVFFEADFISVFTHLMISWLLIFLENFLFIIKRLFFHKYMLLTATSTTKWPCAGNWWKTTTRSSTAADMTTPHCRPITRPTMLVNSLKNGLKIFVFGWCRSILSSNKRITDVVSTHRGLEAFMPTSCDSSWWYNWIFSFTRGRFWSRGLTHFTVRRTLSVILWGVLALP
jgi:hypothetical protein